MSLCLTSHQQLRSYGDGTTAYSLNQQARGTNITIKLRNSGYKEIGGSCIKEYFLANRIRLSEILLLARKSLSYTSGHVTVMYIGCIGTRVHGVKLRH